MGGMGVYSEEDVELPVEKGMNPKDCSGAWLKQWDLMWWRRAL